MKYRVLIEVIIEAPDGETAQRWVCNSLRGNTPDEFDGLLVSTATVEKVKED